MFQALLALLLLSSATAARAAVPTWDCTLSEVFACDEAGHCEKQKAATALSFHLTPGSLEFSIDARTFRGLADVLPIAAAPENGFAALVRGAPRPGQPSELLLSGTVSRGGLARALLAGKHYLGACE